MGSKGTLEVRMVSDVFEAVKHMLGQFLSTGLFHIHATYVNLAILNRFLRRTRSENPEMPPGIEPGTLDHKAVTLANLPRRSRKILKLS